MQSGCLLPALTGAAMIRTAGILAASLAVGWFGFFVVSNIDMGDVVVYNNIQKHVGSEPFKAGDVVAISADGQRMSLVCSMGLGQGVLQETPIAKTYVNGLSAALPQFAAVVDWVAGLAGRSETGQDLSEHPAELQFVGRVSSFPVSGLALPMSRDCTCAVAASLLERSQLCTVERSLIETEITAADDGSRPTRHDRTVGVTFRGANIFIADFSKLDCPSLQATANFQMPQQSGLCSQGPERSFDVALRHSLGVIREQRIPLQE